MERRNEEENRREEEGNYTINRPSEGEREEKGDGEERHGVRREMRLTGTRLERRGEMRKREEESGMHHSSNDTMQSISDFSFLEYPEGISRRLFTSIDTLPLMTIKTTH